VDHQLLTRLHNCYEILMDLENDPNRTPQLTKKMIACGLKRFIEDRRLIEEHEARQRLIEREVVNVKQLAERVAEMGSLQEEGAILRLEVQKAKITNRNLAAVARKTFVAVRCEARNYRELIRECCVRLVGLRNEKQLVRERIGMEHPLLKFLERLEEVGSRIHGVSL
jgi:hypothetical protein